MEEQRPPAPPESVTDLEVAQLSKTYKSLLEAFSNITPPLISPANLQGPALVIGLLDTQLEAWMKAFKEIGTTEVEAIMLPTLDPEHSTRNTRTAQIQLRAALRSKLTHPSFAIIVSPNSVLTPVKNPTNTDMKRIGEIDSLTRNLLHAGAQRLDIQERPTLQNEWNPKGSWFLMGHEFNPIYAVRVVTKKINPIIPKSLSASSRG